MGLKFQWLGGWLVGCLLVWFFVFPGTDLDGNALINCPQRKWMQMIDTAEIVSK
jgi:hypothetical protein